MDSQAANIVKWAEKTAKPANAPAYKRLTSTDVAMLLKYKQQGLTQTEMAQRLGCTQPTVSKWLDNLTDTREPAKEYLAGQSLRMAKNIVAKGMARDHIQALNGLGVLNQQDTGKVSITINGLSLHGTARAETIEAESVSPSTVQVQGESSENP